ncbi:exodeoxyribonuclease VII small subunit [Indiicoccus explosivorum]|uniref:exodeoxyribonuclease VII small subunit n=1 Tax=Indiicoccus explosivorum TaxID=1917864 RepID=UPI000B435113|nr:exodeoxyribonuclease VII small subunit [Indiicoccus explosivorum]
MTEKELLFNEAMEQLEDIVRRLENGDVPLEESLKLYQRGMELSKVCHDKLQHAEKQLVTMMEDGGEVPFESGTGGQDT